MDESTSVVERGFNHAPPPCRVSFQFHMFPSTWQYLKNNGS